MKNVLVPLDGTPEAEKALSFVTQLCSQGDSLVLLMVTKPESSIRTGSIPGRRVRGGFGGLSGGVSGLVTPEVPTYGETADQAGERQTNEATDYLQSLATKLAQTGILVRVEAVTDEHAANAIVKFAKTMQPTFIAMQQRHQSGLAGALLGSVASHVLQAEVAPVLLVPSGS